MEIARPRPDAMRGGGGARRGGGAVVAILARAFWLGKGARVMIMMRGRELAALGLGHNFRVRNSDW